MLVMGQLEERHVEMQNMYTLMTWSLITTQIQYDKICTVDITVDAHLLITLYWNEPGVVRCDEELN